MFEMLQGYFNKSKMIINDSIRCVIELILKATCCAIFLSELHRNSAAPLLLALLVKMCKCLKRYLSSIMFENPTLNYRNRCL